MKYDKETPIHENIQKVADVYSGITILEHCQMGDLFDLCQGQKKAQEVYPNMVVNAWFAQALKAFSTTHSMEPPFLHRNILRA